MVQNTRYVVYTYPKLDVDNLVDVKKVFSARHTKKGSKILILEGSYIDLKRKKGEYYKLEINLTTKTTLM